MFWYKLSRVLEIIRVKPVFYDLRVSGCCSPSCTQTPFLDAMTCGSHKQVAQGYSYESYLGVPQHTTLTLRWTLLLQMTTTSDKDTWLPYSVNAPTHQACFQVSLSISQYRTVQCFEVRCSWSFSVSCFFSVNWLHLCVQLCFYNNRVMLHTHSTPPGGIHKFKLQYSLCSECIYNWIKF